MATEAQLNQALLDVKARRVAWTQLFDQLLADANAYVTQQQGRPLPPANTLGQLPAQGVVITQQVEPPQGRQE